MPRHSLKMQLKESPCPALSANRQLSEQSPCCKVCCTGAEVLSIFLFMIELCCFQTQCSNFIGSLMEAQQLFNCCYAWLTPSAGVPVSSIHVYQSKSVDNCFQHLILLSMNYIEDHKMAKPVCCFQIQLSQQLFTGTCQFLDKYTVVVVMNDFMGHSLKLS